MIDVENMYLKDVPNIPPEVQRKLKTQYARAKMQANSSIGSLVANRCFEPISQAILKGMHTAGNKSEDVTLMSILGQSSSDKTDKIFLRPLVTPVVAAQKLLSIMHKNLNELVYLQVGDNVYLDVAKMVVFGKTCASYGLVQRQPERIITPNGNERTVYRYSVGEVGLAEHTQVSDTIYFDGEIFTIEAEFKKFVTSLETNQMSQYVDVNGMYTYNIEKVYELYGPFVARTMSAYVLWKTYNYDPVAISTITGYSCGNQKFRKARAAMYSDYGILTELTTDMARCSAKLATSFTVDSKPGGHLSDSVALNIDMKTVGSTSYN